MAVLGTRASGLIYGAALAVAVTVYVVVPDLRPAAVVGVGSVCASAIVFASLTVRPERWGAWLLIASAVIMFAVANGVEAAVGAGARLTGYPGIQGVLTVACHLVLTMGLLWLGKPALPSRDWPAILDTTVLSLAVSLVTWIFLAQPLLALDLAYAGYAAVIASWVAYGTVTAATARLILSWHGNAAVRVLLGGVASLLVSDFVYVLAIVRGVWQPGEPISLPSIGVAVVAFAGLCGAAALMPSMARITSVEPAEHTWGPVSLAMLSIGLLVGPTTLLVQATSGEITSAVAIAVLSGAIAVLILTRLGLLATAYRRRLRQAEVMRHALRALVAATNDSDVIEILRTAFAAMLPDRRRPPGQSVEWTTVPAGDTAPAACRDVAIEGRPLAELTLPVQPTAGTSPCRAVVFRATTVALAELSPQLTVLTNQAGLALERIALMAQIHEAEREHYFRTLVLTSTEVILISRHGRVEYATPSAHDLFGRDVRGERLPDLVLEDSQRRPDERQLWSRGARDAESCVVRADGRRLIVLAHTRDLTADPTINGVVTTLRDVTAEREAQRALAYRASHDALTGLVNAARFRESVYEEGERASRRGQLSAVLTIDLDNFKEVNDAFGHEIGDALLTAAARRIQSGLREQDLPARMGGDEFGVLLRRVPDATAARATTRRICQGLAVPAVLQGITVDCGASVGLALARTKAEHGSLLRRADTALYAAKADGKGRWREYKDTMTDPVRRQLDARAVIERLIDDELLTLRYEPVVELATGRVAGFEASVHATRDIGTPSEHLTRAADGAGLAARLGDWVLTRAVSDAALLNPPGTIRPRYVSTSTSVRHAQRDDFVDRVRTLLAETRTRPSLLAIEIEEIVGADGDERTWEHLTQLRHDGVHIAIASHGIDHLRLLTHPAIDVVKIGSGFLWDIGRVRPGLPEAMAELGIKLGLVLVAEGVVDTKTRDALVAMGCRYGQGPLYPRTMDIDAAAAVSTFT